MRPITTGFLCTLFALLATRASGQDAQAASDIITDRPDQTESSATVKPGMVQIESGWLREDVDGDASSSRSRSESALGTLLRIGLFEQMELRVGWQGLVETKFGDNKVGEIKTDGSGDGELGIKWHLWREQGKRPDAAIIVGTSVPMGSTAITNDGWDPAFRFAFSHELSANVGIAYNLGYAWETEQDANGKNRDGAALWTVAVGSALTDRFGAFVELFGALPDGGSESSIDGGLTWLLKPNFQLDLYGGVGLSSTAPDTFIGFGFSWRLPN